MGDVQLKEPLVGFDEYDLNQIVADRAAIDAINPHRFELALLDAVVFIDDERSVAYRDVRSDDFWTRGHFPQLPLMPGVLVAETAAQLTCYIAGYHKLRGDGLLGLGGLDDCRFRAPVRPGDRLVVQVRIKRKRPNVMIVTEFQAYVGQTLCAEGIIKGTVLPNSLLD